MQNYSSFVSYAVSQEMAVRDRNRKRQITQSGYAFIVLELDDVTKRRVSGVDCLKQISTEKRGKYKFEVVSRQLEFFVDVNRGEALIAYVLDTERNRKFLASHHDCGYWDIVDVISGRRNKNTGSEEKKLTIDVVIEDIVKLRKKLAEETINAHSGSGKIPHMAPEGKPYDIANFDDETLELELANRKKARMTPVEENAGNDLGTGVSEEEFKKLTPAQKGKITKARNAAKKIKRVSNNAKVAKIPAPSEISEPVKIQNDPKMSTLLTRRGVAQP
jgi:hypothetical protein